MSEIHPLDVKWAVSNLTDAQLTVLIDQLSAGYDVRILPFFSVIAHLFQEQTNTDELLRVLKAIHVTRLLNQL